MQNVRGLAATATGREHFHCETIKPCGRVHKASGTMTFGELGTAATGDTSGAFGVPTMTALAAIATTGSCGACATGAVGEGSGAFAGACSVFARARGAHERARAKAARTMDGAV